MSGRDATGAPVLTARPLITDSVICISAKLIIIGHPRGLMGDCCPVFAFPPILTLRPPYARVVIRSVLTTLLVWGVRGDAAPTLPFL